MPNLDRDTLESTPEINRAQNRAPIRSLDDLADAPRWVAWQEEIRERADGSTFKTKIPYDPSTGAQARIPTDPTSWSTRAHAERRWSRLDNGERRGGVGIVLGDLGNGYTLMGIDPDHCLQARSGADLDVNPLANEVIERFDSYAEISPSGKGIKIFFLVAAEGMDAVQRLLGFENGKAKARKTFAVDKHLEMALDRARFYAVTGEYLEDAQRLRPVDVETVRWFIREAGPRFLQLHRPANEVAGARDESGSGYGFRFMGSMKALGKSFADARDAIFGDKGKAGEWAYRVDLRQLERAYEKAPAVLAPDFIKPRQLRVTPAISAWELKNMEFPPLKYVVPDLIVEGLTIFAGKPKIGKSWLMLHIGNAVANGASTLGGIHCEPGDVLYCALEDNLRRLQQRMYQLGMKQWSKHLQFRCDLPRLDEGGLEVIRDWYGRPNTRAWSSSTPTNGCARLAAKTKPNTTPIMMRWRNCTC
jgi:hypothetical protein